MFPFFQKNLQPKMAGDDFVTTVQYLWQFIHIPMLCIDLIDNHLLQLLYINIVESNGTRSLNRESFTPIKDIFLVHSGAFVTL